MLDDKLLIMAKNIDYFETGTYNHIKICCDMKLPFLIKYENSFTLFSNSVEGSTYIKWEQTYIDIDRRKIPFLDKMLSDSKKQMKSLFEDINVFLKNRVSKQVVQTEAVIVNKPQLFVWKIVSDFREFIGHVAMVADVAEYEGEPNVVGSKVTLKWLDKKITCFLRVSLVCNLEDNEEWQYELECYDGVPKIPPQTLIFQVKKVNESSCLLTFKHIFQSELKQDYIALISKEKKQIISKLRESCL
jgi:hypothetical protein